MRTFKLTHTTSSEVLKQKMKVAKTASDFKRWQIIYLINTYNVDASYLSDITSYSKANIYTIVRQYNESDEGDVNIQKRGGRRRSLMSIDQEKHLMEGLEQKASEGQILTYLDIKTIVEKEIGKEVSDDFIWDLFKRNNWTKHSPRLHHPKKDKDKQEEFKKNSRTIWMPLKMILQQS